MSIEAVTPFFPAAQPRPVRPSAEVVRPFGEQRLAADQGRAREENDSRQAGKARIDSRPRNLLDRSTLLNLQEQGSESSSNSKPGELTEEEQQQVQELKKRDAEVRRHEQAHANAGGQYAGSPQYEFENGPDGKQYAVGGHVPIDVSPIAGDPKATIRKMNVVQRAASAPAEPSGEDRAVAAQAQQEKAKAQQELAKDNSGAVGEPGTDAEGEEATEGTDSAGGASSQASETFVPFESLFGLAG